MCIRDSLGTVNNKLEEALEHIEDTLREDMKMCIRDSDILVDEEEGEIIDWKTGWGSSDPIQIKVYALSLIHI